MKDCTKSACKKGVVRWAGMSLEAVHEHDAAQCPDILRRKKGSPSGDSLYVEVLLIGCLEKERQFLLEYFWNQTICNTSVYVHITIYQDVPNAEVSSVYGNQRLEGAVGFSFSPTISVPPELLLAVTRWWIPLDLAQSPPWHIQTATNMNYLIHIS